MHRLVVFVATLYSLSGLAWAADSVRGQEQQQEGKLIEESIGSTITVIRLKWANAEELAATLAPILPEGLTVLAYPPLNALIIARNHSAPKR